MAKGEKFAYELIAQSALETGSLPSGNGLEPVDKITIGLAAEALLDADVPLPDSLEAQAVELVEAYCADEK